MHLKRYVQHIIDVCEKSTLFVPLCFFGIFLFTRVVFIFMSPDFFDTSARLNLFIVRSILDGIIPSPLFFQIRVPYGGAGSLMFSLFSSPLCFFLGKDLFALRIVSVIIVGFIFWISYALVKKYIGEIAAIFCSAFFAFMPYVFARYSLVGEGRHFHLNLFIILALLFFLKYYEKKNFLNWGTFVLIAGLGMYFYPAFIICLAAFFLTASLGFLCHDYKRSAYLMGGVIVAVLVGVAYEFFVFHGSSIQLLKNFFLFSPKTVQPDTRFLPILYRFGVMLFYNVPNMIFSRESTAFFDVTYLDSFKEFIVAIGADFSMAGGGISRGVYRIFFIIVYLGAICFLCRFTIKGVRQRILSQKIDLQQIFFIFCLIYFFIFILGFSFSAEKFELVKYIIPLYCPLIFMLSFFLQEIIEKKKFLGVVCAIILFVPGIRFQSRILFNYDDARDTYKYFITFYEDDCSDELFSNKSMELHVSQALAFDERASFSLGGYYADAVSYERDVSENITDFFRLPNKIEVYDAKKAHYVCEGFFAFLSQIKYTLKELTNGEKYVANRYKPSFYRGLGKGCFKSFCPIYNSVNENHEIDLIYSIINALNVSAQLIPMEYRDEFYEGAGKALAGYFARYLRTGISEECFYNRKVLWQYLVSFRDKDNRRSFFKGFQNKKIWERL